MPNNAAETVIAANGAIYIAPVGTAYPVAPGTAPAAAWLHLGFANEDGVTFKPTMEVTDFGAWQTAFPIRSVVTSRGVEIAFALRQWNEVTLPLALGGGTVTGAGPYVYEPPAASDTYEKALLVRWSDGTKLYELQVLKVTPSDLQEIALLRTEISDLGVALRMLDDGDPATAPWRLVTTDANFAAS